MISPSMDTAVPSEQPLPDAGEALVEAGDELTDRAGVHLDLGDAARDVAEAGVEVDPCRHDPPASMASSTLTGLIGRSVMRVPMASRMALATAASGGTIPTSPTPRTP